MRDPRSSAESDSSESDSEGEEALCCEDRRACCSSLGYCKRKTPKEICCYSFPYVPVLVLPFGVTNLILITLWGAPPSVHPREIALDLTAPFSHLFGAFPEPFNGRYSLLPLGDIPRHLGQLVSPP